jgi:hypothetical protein
MFVCPKCNKEFTTKGNLKMHLNKKFKCDNNDIINVKKEEQSSSEQSISKLINLVEKLLENKNATNTINSNNTFTQNNTQNNTQYNTTNIQKNDDNKIIMNFQYIEKNFINAQNLEDIMKDEKIPKKTIEKCKNLKINDGAVEILKDTCINGKKIEERSFHCLDVSRKKFAVKTANKWEKDYKGQKLHDICTPVILSEYKNLIDNIIKNDKEISNTKKNEIMCDFLAYREDKKFYKSLDDCINLVDIKNNEDNIVEEKYIEDTKKTIKNNMYDSFMEEKTKVSKEHIHTQTLYESFVEWYKQKEDDKKNDIPSNKEFVKNIRSNYYVNKSVKVGDKVSTGIKHRSLK